MKTDFDTSSHGSGKGRLRQADLQKTNGWVGGEISNVRRYQKGTTIPLKQGAIVTMKPEKLRHAEIRFRARQDIAEHLEEGARFQVRLMYKGIASNVSADYTGVKFFAEQARPLGDRPWPPRPRHAPSG